MHRAASMVAFGALLSSCAIVGGIDKDYTECGKGEAPCATGCAELESDPKNCGACGSACPAGVACTAGKCACPGGRIACGGACVDTSSDPKNCSRCGRACDGCAMSMCPAVELNDSQDADIADIAVDDAAIYWTNTNTIVRRDFASQTETVLASGQTKASALSYDGQGRLYWTDEAPTTAIRSVAVSGGSPTDHATTTGSVWGIAANATGVYWLENDTGLVRRVVPPATTIEDLATNQTGGSALAVDAGHAYWAIYGNGAMYELALGQPNIVTVFNATSPEAVVAGPTDLYVGGADRNIYRVPIMKGKSTPVAMDPRGDFGSIVVDGTSIYWTAQNDGRVMRAPLDGSSMEVLATDQTFPRAMVADATNLYWLTSDGFVRSVPK
jgi:hypothetical protein